MTFDIYASGLDAAIVYIKQRADIVRDSRQINKAGILC